MKVLFLTKYPEEGASSRYRVYQYLPYLDDACIDYDVQPFMSSSMYRRMMRSGGTILKALDTLLAVIRRVTMVRRAKRYDLVFMQRDCLPFGAPWLERIFKRLGIRTIFDYDDALFIFKGSTHNKLADRFKRPEKYPEIFSLADCVLAGNDWLRDQAAEYCQDARTFYVAEDLNRYSQRPLHAEGHSVVIGWLGSPSTEKYLALIEPALRNVCTRYPHVQLKIIGGGSFQSNEIAVEHVPWGMDTEVDQLQSFDIGIMPLPLEEWSKGKSGGKARTYMAVGLPAVCTRIGFNCELIRDGQTGFLVESIEEWTAALSQLVANSELRQRIGDAARKEVEGRYSLQRLGPEFVRILKEIALQ